MIWTTALTYLYLWPIIGVISMACTNFIDWRRGIDLEASWLLWSLIIGAGGGPITFIFTFHFVFMAIYHVICGALSPLNFTIKGRKV